MYSSAGVGIWPMIAPVTGSSCQIWLAFCSLTKTLVPGGRATAVQDIMQTIGHEAARIFNPPRNLRRDDNRAVRENASLPRHDSLSPPTAPPERPPLSDSVYPRRAIEVKWPRAGGISGRPRRFERHAATASRIEWSAIKTSWAANPSPVRAVTPPPLSPRARCSPPTL